MIPFAEVWRAAGKMVGIRRRASGVGGVVEGEGEGDGDGVADVEGRAGGEVDGDVDTDDGQGGIERRWAGDGIDEGPVPVPVGECSPSIFAFA